MQFISVGQSFQDLVATLSNRVRIEQQTEGWAVIIDGEVYTWGKSEDRARDVAIKLIDAGI